MPIVKVSMWEGRSKEQKQKLAEAITKDIVEIAKTTPDETIVIFEDIKKENWIRGQVEGLNR